MLLLNTDTNFIGDIYMFRSSLEICTQLVNGQPYVHKAILYLFRCVSFIWVYVCNIYQRPPAAAGEQRHAMGRNCRGHNRLAIINGMAPQNRPDAPPPHSHHQRKARRDPEPGARITDTPRWPTLRVVEGKPGGSEMYQQRYYRVVIRDAGIRIPTDSCW